jgi:hypothetical protein
VISKVIVSIGVVLSLLVLLVSILNLNGSLSDPYTYRQVWVTGDPEGYWQFRSLENYRSFNSILAVYALAYLAGTYKFFKNQNDRRLKIILFLALVFLVGLLVWDWMATKRTFDKF